MPDVDINIVIPRESFMSDFPDLLYARYGCIENYFDAIGVDLAVQTAIREKCFRNSQVNRKIYGKQKRT